MDNKTVRLVFRTLLGLIFTVFGFNGLLMAFGHAGFLPMPPMTPAAGAVFGSGLFQTAYFFKLLKLTEVIAGLMLLTGIFTPLALVLLAPIVVNIFLFHLFLARHGMPLPVVIAVLETIVAYQYRDAFRGLFTRK